MKGYRNNVEATEAAITEDAWFKSGDLAKLDEKGAVTIVDRLKELIKVFTIIYYTISTSTKNPFTLHYHTLSLCK